MAPSPLELLWGTNTFLCMILEFGLESLKKMQSFASQSGFRCLHRNPSSCSSSSSKTRGLSIFYPVFKKTQRGKKRWWMQASFTGFGGVERTCSSSHSEPCHTKGDVLVGDSASWFFRFIGEEGLPSLPTVMGETADGDGSMLSLRLLGELECWGICIASLASLLDAIISMEGENWTQFLNWEVQQTPLDASPRRKKNLWMNIQQPDNL